MINKLIDTAIKKQMEGSFIIDCHTSSAKDVIENHYNEFKKLSNNNDKYIYKVLSPKQAHESVRKTEFKPTDKYFHQILIDGNEIVKSPVTIQKLLKFLEEPSRHTQTFIFTNNLNSLPSTIKSRCVTAYGDDSKKYQPTSNEVLKLITKLKNKEISLSEISLKIKAASLEDSKTILKEVLADNRLKKLSFSQIDYIQKMLIKIDKYQKLNMPLLDNFLPVIRKLLELDKNNGKQ